MQPTRSYSICTFCLRLPLDLCIYIDCLDKLSEGIEGQLREGAVPLYQLNKLLYILCLLFLFMDCLPTAKRTWQAMLVFIHPCNLVGEIPQTPERFQRNQLRSCEADLINRRCKSTTEKIGNHILRGIIVNTKIKIFYYGF